MDGTTWGGWNGTDPSGHNFYGVASQADAQFQSSLQNWTQSWGLLQTGIPSHSHVGAQFAFNVQPTSYNGAYGPTGSVTLSGPDGTATLPIHSDGTYGSLSWTDNISVSYDNGYLEMTGLDTNTTGLRMRITPWIQVGP